MMNYDASFVLNGYPLSGISDVTFSSENSLEVFKTLGARNFGFSKAGPSVGEVDFSRSLIYQDPVLSLTGDSACSGSFSSSSFNYAFYSGYLTDYSVSCSVGQVPTVGTKIKIFGEMKNSADTLPVVTHPDIFVPSPKSISVSTEHSSTNRVQSFDCSFAVNREPKYSVNTLFPDAVVRNGPIDISASVTYNIKNFSPIDLQKFVREISAPSFIISIKDRTLTQTVASFSIQNAHILSHSLQGTVDSPLSLTVNYGGFYE